MGEWIAGTRAHVVGLLLVGGLLLLSVAPACKHQAHLSSREQAAVDRVLRDRWTDAKVVYRDPHERDHLIVVTQQGDEEVSYRVIMGAADEEPIIQRLPLYSFGPR